jgi:hypothetical protein
MGGSNAAFVLSKGGTRQQRAYENQEPAVSFHDDLLEQSFWTAALALTHGRSRRSRVLCAFAEEASMFAG